MFSLNVHKMAITLAHQRSILQIQKPAEVPIKFMSNFFSSISWPIPFKMSSFSDYLPGFLSGEDAVLVVLQVGGPHPRYGPTVRRTHGGSLKCRLFWPPCTIPARLPERPERSPHSPEGCRSSPALWADCSPDTWRSLGPLKCRLFLTPLYYTCQASWAARTQSS